jgi:hypothetical protein
VKRAALLGCVAVLAVGCSGSHSTTLGGYGISLSLPHGWYGLSAPGQLQAADFPLAHNVLASAERARVQRGHVHVIVWDYGPAVSYLARSHPQVTGPLRFRRGDVSGPFEGFPSDHAFAIRSVNLDGELLEILADFGPKPLAAARLRAANHVVASLKVSPVHVIRPRGGVLSRDGVSLRLLPGWSGRIEVPVSTFADRFVLRARRQGTRLALLEVPNLFPVKQVRLPITLHRDSKTFARSVVMANGHSFDISAVFTSSGGLTEAQRLIAGLSVRPRAWNLSLCDFSLRLPGPWTAGVRQKGHSCYLIVTFRAPGLKVVLEELRPREHATGRVLRRDGRRFEVSVSPSSAAGEADPVLATLRSRPQSAIKR